MQFRDNPVIPKLDDTSVERALSVFIHLHRELVMKIRSPVLLAVLAAGLVPFSVYAGAEANVYACIYVPTKPVSPLSVSFTAGSTSDHCMYHTGTSATMTVNDPGLTCTSVGKMESKASSSKGDLCATDSSIWGLSYTITGTAYSGSTLTDWSHKPMKQNKVKLKDSSPGTALCSNKALCEASEIQWNRHSTGTLYVIFRPTAVR